MTQGTYVVEDDPAALGGTCTYDDNAFCADDGKSLHGRCVPEPPRPVCNPLCQTSSDCPAGQSCHSISQAMGLPDLGVCE